jgi:hypothetical protein
MIMIQAVRDQAGNGDDGDDETIAKLRRQLWAEFLSHCGQYARVCV